MSQEAELKTIFLIEDNQGDIRLIKEAFKSTGTPCNVAIARDGIAAMEHLQGVIEGRCQSPDLILLDLNLPKKDGRELLADIKANVDLQHIPIVVLTTSQNEEDITDCYDLHANCYITKSRTLAQLFTIIKGIDEFWLQTAALPNRMMS